MPIEVVIPKLGMTMQEGTLVEWLRPDGASVAVGDPIFVLNTDKLDAEIEAEAAGTLRHVAKPGDTLPTGGLLGLIVPEGEIPASAANAPTVGAPEVEPAPALSPDLPRAVSSNGSPNASPNARRLSRELGVALSGISGSGAAGRIVGRDVEAAALTAQSPLSTETPRASFAARRVASNLGIDLAQVTGSRPGEITRQDVERAVAQLIQARATPSNVVIEPQPVEHESSTPIPMTGMRGVIARRMHSSLQEMAQLTIGMEARADKLSALRDELKIAWGADGRAVPTFTDMVALAAARVLPRHPRLNAVVGSKSIELLTAVHIGVAVAVDDGLVVPVVRDANLLSLSDFAASSAHLVGLSRSGGMSVDDMAGATFSVTSLGGYGVDFFTPVINPPNVATLGVGRIRDGVRFTKKRRARPSRSMTLSLTFDHRAVDGAPAAEFLRDLCQLLEAPGALLR